MKYDHLIKHNGVYYRAGEDVPCDSPAAENDDEAGKHPTKTEVSRMSVDELKAYAPTIGIEVTEESTGSKLKEQIIAKLGL